MGTLLLKQSKYKMPEEKVDFGTTVYVVAGSHEDRVKRTDDALKRFRRRVERYKVLDELKERQFYSKPSYIKNKKRKK